MRRPKLHEACKSLPQLDEKELQELADDIAENGLHNLIVMYDGAILDEEQVSGFQTCGSKAAFH